MVCPECNMAAWTDHAVGRRRRFCSNACRQAAYRRGASGQTPRPLRTGPVAALSDEGGLFRPPSIDVPGRDHVDPATPGPYAVEQPQQTVTWQTVPSRPNQRQGGDL
jgi:hypothetical protein